MTLVKTKGIVLQSIKFKETSLIVKIYTQDYGIQSFIINGVRSKKPKFASAFFQPLTLLDIVFYYKENQSLKRISELKCSPPLTSLHFDLKKAAISIFITEILLKTLNEENSDEELFNFLVEGIITLDINNVNPDFHLVFLVKLSSYLGFAITAPEDLTLNKDTQEIVNAILNEDLTGSVVKSNHFRKVILNHLLNFYGSHFDNMKDMRSIKVLNDLFS